MYLHIGQNVVVPKESVLGVFDIDNTTSSHITRKYLNECEKNGEVINICLLYTSIRTGLYMRQ